MGSNKYFSLLPIFLLLSFHYSYSQAPQWVWAKSANNISGHPSSNGIGTDAAGNIYAIGHTPGTIGFGVNTAPLSAGMFLVKYDPHGNPLWAKSANCIPAAICTDSAGNTHVTGRFQETLILGADTLICQAKWDMFTAKFDSNGNVLWARSAGGAAHPPQWHFPALEEDEGRTITVDAAGNCYVGATMMTSKANNTVNFDTISLQVIPAGLFARFSTLAKYNYAGQIQWVSQIGGEIRSLAANSQGGCYLLGMYSDSISFSGTTLVAKGQHDVYYARYNGAGNTIWAKSLGGAGNDFGEAIAANTQGEVFLAGTFENAVQMEALMLTGHSERPTLYLIKCDSNGNLLWASQASGSGNTYEPRIAVDNSGNCYVSCNFSGKVAIGKESFSSLNAFHSDVLVTKWNKSGAPEWTVAAKGGGYDRINGIVFSPGQYSWYVTGTFEDNLVFGNHVLNTGLISNFYIAKLQSNGNFLPEILPKSGCDVNTNPAKKRR